MHQSSLTAPLRLAARPLEGVIQELQKGQGGGCFSLACAPAAAWAHSLSDADGASDAGSDQLARTRPQLAAAA